MRIVYWIWFAIFMAGGNYCHAQLCTGSLGDPIINQDFGSGRGFVMPPGSSPLTKVNSCPNKGEYIISNFLFGCGSNGDRSWLQMVGDHTRNQNGNYMLVNGENTTGTIYVDTARNLCAGTNYVFSAWISNAMQDFTCNKNPVLANLILTVEKPDGTVLRSTATGDIPTASGREWKEYGFAFVPPAGVSTVVVKISSAMRPGCGAAFVMDDITVRSCGPSVSITLDGATNNGNVCADYSAPFLLESQISGGYTDPVLQWQQSLDTGKTWNAIPGANTSTYAIPRRSTGVINYRLFVSERSNLGSPGCGIRSNDIYTEIHPVPEHRPPSNFFGCLDKNLALPATDPKALSVLWNGPNGYTSTDPAAVVNNVQYRDTGLYVLRQGFYFGCTTIDSFYLAIFPSTTINALPGRDVCEGTSQQLQVTATGGGSFQWYPSTGLSDDKIGNPIATPKDTTEYKVVVTNQYGCKDSATILINVFRNIKIDAGPDKTILEGDTAVLQPIIAGTGVVYSWSPVLYLTGAQTPDPKAFPPESYQYTLSGISTVGCGIASDQVWVKVYKTLQIPNAFTPNGDGKNDVFRVLPLDNFTLKEFFVVDQFGQRVFSTGNIQQAWDGNFRGKPQPAGTYVYYVEMYNRQGKKIQKKGTLTLIR